MIYINSHSSQRNSVAQSHIKRTTLLGIRHLVLILLMFQLPDGLLYGQAGGNSCITASLITTVPNSFFAAGPNAVGGTPAGICFGLSQTTAAEWYVYTPLSDVNVTIASCIFPVNTRLSVYSGTCAELTCVVSNDDACGFGGSTVNFCASGGTPYYIEWDNRWSGEAFLWTITETPTSCGATLAGGANCSTATAVTIQDSPILAAGSDSVNGQPASNCFSTETATAAEWYSYTPTTDVEVTFSSCHGGSDTRLSVYDGSCGGLTCIAFNDDACDVSPILTLWGASSVTFCASAGTSYYLEWDNYWDGLPFSWTITENPATCPNPCFADRAEMVDALLNQDSGLDHHPTLSNVWSPYVDFGFGAGYEGLVPAGTLIEPGMAGTGPAVVAPFDAYFFWIDRCPPCGFVHPTSFVLADPTDCTPTIEEGTVLVSDQLSWAKITVDDTTELEFFKADPLTSMSLGPDNLDGFIDGLALHPDSVYHIPVPAPDTTSTRNSAAVVVRGSEETSMLNDVRKWRQQLQEEMGVHSDRILRSASETSNDPPVTKQQFCDLLDSLCVLEPAPDTIYIRISTHGDSKSLCFADGDLDANTLCTKFRGIAKKGVPIMLLIDACEAEGLLDANKWNFPAGSMITFGAGATESSYMVNNVSLADNSGNPIPGTEFSGSLFPDALIRCQNDPEADINQVGGVDDCEAFIWLDAQKPCYIEVIDPAEQLGSFSITNYRYYPAGPAQPIITPDSVLQDGRIIKDGAIIYPNPEPSYHPVGEFAESMNFNVQNNTGESQSVFYMVFSGDVTSGNGRAWESTSEDKRGAYWADPESVTSTYDAEKDETAVCWMASGDPAEDGAYVHFGYFDADKRLRPKKQFWGNQNENTPESDSTSVPSVQSSIRYSGTDSSLIINITNLNEFSGGTGHPVEIISGYKVSNNYIPLSNLFLCDTMVYHIPLNPLGEATLDTNNYIEYELEVPEDIKVGEHLILQLELGWTLNGNTIMKLIQWPALDPLICRDNVIFESGDTVPEQTNTDGTITLQNVVFGPGITTLNAAGGVLAAPDALVTIPDGATVVVYDYGCTEDIPNVPQGQQLLIGPDGQIMLKEMHTTHSKKH